MDKETNRVTYGLLFSNEEMRLRNRVPAGLFEAEQFCANKPNF